MRGSFKIPVYSGGGTSNPDPAVYCPLNGYVLDDYQPDPDNFPMPEPDPSGDEILLVVGDVASAGDFYTSISINGGGYYDVRFYGENYALVAEYTELSSSNYLTIPYGYGYTSNGKSTFLVRITPSVSSDTFSSINFSSGTNEIYEAIIKAPSVGSLSQMMYMTKLQMVDISVCESITTLYRTFYGCSELERIIMPPTMDYVTTMDSTFYNCTLLASVILPTDSMNAITDMGSTFRNTSLSQLIMPASMPSLQYLDYTCAYTRVKKIVMPDDISSVIDMSNFAAYNDILKTVTMPTQSMDSCSTVYRAFANCPNLRDCTWPAMPVVTTMANVHYYNTLLETLTLPTSLPLCTNIGNMASTSPALKSITLPTSMPELVTANNAFYNCASLATINMPSDWPKVINCSYFAGNTAITSFTFPTIPLATNLARMFTGCSDLVTLTFPASVPSATDCSGIIYGCSSLTTINTTVWGYSGVKWNSNNNCVSLTSFNQPTLQPCYMEFEDASLLTSINIDWANAPWVNNGSYPSIEIQDCNLDATELDRIMGLLPTVSSGQKIDINPNPGYATCDPTIATAKGWTVQ